MSGVIKNVATLAVLLALSAALPASPVATRQGNEKNKSAEQQSSDVLKVNTRMVLVDAVVTNRSGESVQGLKADDFQILENGQPQTIRAFGARSPEILQQQAAAAPMPATLQPGMFTNITEFHPEYGPLTILLIDSLNTGRLDQVSMREALIKYLQTIGPRHNIVIFTLGTRLGLVQNLNGDPGLLQEALKRIAADPSLKKTGKQSSSEDDPEAKASALAADLLGIGPAYDKERQIEQMERSVLEFFPDQIFPTLDSRIKLTLMALRTIARNTGGYQGRKNLIWLSAAFPLAVDPITAGFDARDYSAEVQEAANILTNNEISVYPVDVRGLVGNFLPDAASDIERHGSLGGPAVTSTIQLRSLALGASHNTMDHLADQTGGRAYYNRNDIDHGIDTSIQDGSVYYTLGYYPTNKEWDGKFRKVELKLVPRGLQVRYRRGYFAVDTTHRTENENKAGHQEFLAALALDARAATALPILAHVIPPGKEHSQVFVDIGVDPHSVVFEPQPNNRQEGQVEFDTIVVNSQGKPVSSKFDILRTELTPQTFAQVMSSSLVVRQKFDLAAGKYLLRIGVRDAKSNLIGTLIAHVEVPAPD